MFNLHVKPKAMRSNTVSLKRKKETYKAVDSPVDHILRIQGTIGNQAVQRLFNSGVTRANLQIGKPNDKYEQKADRVADILMLIPKPVSPSCRDRVDIRHQTEEEQEELVQHKPIREQITSLIQRQAGPHDEEEQSLQNRGNNSNTIEVNPRFESSINSLKAGGQPLPESVRSYFEPKFGYDFNGVRVYTGYKASYAARSVNSRAFTLGNNIVFNRGDYSPETMRGKKLIAHELTHVVQQTGGEYVRKLNSTPRLDINLQHSNLTTIRRKLLAKSRRTLRDFGKLFSPKDVAILAYKIRTRPYEIIERRRRRRRRRRFDDPFRVRLIREIIKSPSEVLVIAHTSFADLSPPHDLYYNGRRIKQNIRRTIKQMSHTGIGVHIAARNLAMRHRNFSGPVSLINNRSYVLYLDPLSLGHELFGHCYLAIKGSPSGHGKMVSARANILDPFGKRYTGSVNDFIKKYASEKKFVLKITPNLKPPFMRWKCHFSPTKILRWPTPKGGSIRVTYVEFMRRYPRAIVYMKIVRKRCKRFIIF